MSLELRERTSNDSLEVRALFAIHRAYGKDGKLWIKNVSNRREGGAVYRSLVGGVHSVANRPEFRRTHMRDSLFGLLYSALPRRYRLGRVLSYAGACQDYSDHPNTTWKDIEDVLRGAIIIGRERANA